jgi:hypothetical protein
MRAWQRRARKYRGIKCHIRKPKFTKLPPEKEKAITEWLLESAAAIHANFVELKIKKEKKHGPTI